MPVTCDGDPMAIAALQPRTTGRTMRHVHFDPLGGAAGDMIVGCLLDAFAEHREAVIAAAQSATAARCRLLAYGDGVLTGSRFVVEPVSSREHARQHGHEHAHEHTQGGHSHWRDVRTGLERSALAPSVCRHAVGIFAVLAEAEGRVHGIAPDEVVFHEVGAVDSVADIVAAAALIEAIGPARWSVASLPLGGGTVHTAHGVMPAPAPATALLLEGFALHDDGIGGERVTPTGAAILRYLVTAPGAPATGGVLARSGTGFGTRRLPGQSNCLRALVFEAPDLDAAGAPGHREIAVISFEVDDQSGEDLALGLARLRGADGVHDVVQMPAFGKKSRLAVHVQVLTRPDVLEEVVAMCFAETTTIGLRTHLVQGRALARRNVRAELPGAALGVKLVQRPDEAGEMTPSGKVEADDLGQVASHRRREQLRREAERQALEGEP